MRFFASSSFAVLSTAAVVSASYNVTIPFVGALMKYDFDEYAATLVSSVENVATTYHLGCPINTERQCTFRILGVTPVVIAGPSTYGWEFPDRMVYEKTNCQLTGSPFPTAGICTETQTRDILTYETVRISTHIVPGTGLFGYSITPAQLIVVGTETPSGSVGAGDAKETKSNSVPRATRTQDEDGTSSVDETARVTSFSTGTSAPGENELPSSTSSTANGAMRTGAPMAGVAAAVAGMLGVLL